MSDVARSVSHNRREPDSEAWPTTAFETVVISLQGLFWLRALSVVE